MATLALLAGSCGSDSSTAIDTQIAPLAQLELLAPGELLPPNLPDRTEPDRGEAEELSELLAERFDGDVSLVDLLDDDHLSAVIPDRRLRAAAIAFSGTIAEPALDWLRTIDPSSSFGGRVVEAAQAALGEPLGVSLPCDGTWIVVIADDMINEPVAALSVLVFHEILHTVGDGEDHSIFDAPASLGEEGVAYTLEAILWAQQIETIPELLDATHSSRLTAISTQLLLQLLNSPTGDGFDGAGPAITQSPGSAYSGQVSVFDRAAPADWFVRPVGEPARDVLAAIGVEATRWDHELIRQLPEFDAFADRSTIRQALFRRGVDKTPVSLNATVEGVGDMFDADAADSVAVEVTVRNHSRVNSFSFDEILARSPGHRTTRFDVESTTLRPGEQATAVLVINEPFAARTDFGVETPRGPLTASIYGYSRKDWTDPPGADAELAEVCEALRNSTPR